MIYKPFHELTFLQKIGAVFGKRYLDDTPENVREVIHQTLRARSDHLATGMAMNNALLERLRKK